jgi:hypothetical protein
VPKSEDKGTNKEARSTNPITTVTQNLTRKKIGDSSNSLNYTRSVQILKESVATMVARRLEQADSGLQNRLRDTLVSVNLILNRRSRTPTSRRKIDGIKGGDQAKKQQIRSKSPHSIVKSSLPSSWGLGLGSGVSGWEGGSKSGPKTIISGVKSSVIGIPPGNVHGESITEEDIQALLLQNTYLEGLLRAVDSALESPPWIMSKDQAAQLKPSYQRPDNIHHVSEKVMLELERINQGLKESFGKDLSDLLQ